MRYIEWLFLLVIGACGTGLANFIGHDVGVLESLPGLVVLVAISMLAVVCIKLIPLKLPIVAYCAIIGLLLADSDLRDRRGGKDQLYGAIYHGRGIRRPGHRRPAESIYQAGTEDIGCGSAGHDRNIPGVLHVGFPDLKINRGDLRSAVRSQAGTYGYGVCGRARKRRNKYLEEGDHGHGKM